MFVSNENENKQLGYEKNNQKFLVNDGVHLYFSNVFDQTGEGKLPMVKHKLRRILVDYGMCQTCMEINQKLNFIKVFYADPQAKELKNFLLQRLNDFNKESQAVEVIISLEGQSCSPPEISRGIKSYPGLTNLLYQEFILESRSYSLVDGNPYNQMKEIIKCGNLQPSLPLTSILAEGVD